ADQQPDADADDHRGEQNAAGPCRVEGGRGGGLHQRGEISRPTPRACNTPFAAVAAFSCEFVTLAGMPRPRLLLVHGSVVNGDLTWVAQRPRAARYELVVPNRRGFPPGPDVAKVDYDDEAEWLEPLLEPGAHLVGHSYGGVIALLAAARRPDLV